MQRHADAGPLADPAAIHADAHGGRLRSALLVAAGAAAIPLICLVLLDSGTSAAVAALGLVVLGTSVSLRHFERIDGLLICVILLMVVPARYRIAPLGAAGTAGALIGLLAFFFWFLRLVTRSEPRQPGPRPVHWTMVGVVVAVLVSYVAVSFRPHDVIEAKAADRGLITLVAILGFALFSADLVDTRAALNRVVRVVVGAGSVVAGLGVVQFFTKLDVAAKLKLPGFAYVPSNYADNRAGFTRIISTTSHPIELSVVLAMLLPLALYVAFSARTRRRTWWMCTAVIAAAIPMTVSRTGILGLAVALGVSLPFWDGRRRWLVLGWTVLGSVAMRLAVPGLMGTLRSFLFTPAGDPSLYSRQIGRAQAVDYWLERPWLGRGFGTFLPQRYTYLDNQMLMSLVETGLVGLVANIAVFLTGAGLAFQTRSRAAGPRRARDRELAAALLAALAVAFSSWFTYDALSFPTSRELTFLVVGLIGAQWAIVARRSPTGSDGGDSPADDHRRPEGPLASAIVTR